MTHEWWNALKAWFDAALSLVYPEVCQCCGNERATPAEGFVGATCRAEVKWIQPPYCDTCGLPFEGQITTEFVCANCREVELHFERARSAVAAQGLVLEVIHRYKYQRALWFEPFLAQMLVHKAVPALGESAWDMIVPVPLHPSKKNEREFNQAERLARHLSTAAGIPLEARTLARVHPTLSQTRLSREERLENVHRAFALTGRVSVEGRSVVLVDDVLTTGATTSACARVLREAGATEVCVWTVARGLLH